MVTRQRILIFGGGFNPPTLAHEAIIAECLALPQFDEIWLMPSGDRTDKTMAASDTHRLRMAEILKQERFLSDPRLMVTDFELRLPRPTETYQTLKALQKSFPLAEFWWALGTDSYESMPTWSHGDELQKTLNVLLFGRGGAPTIERPNVARMEIHSDLARVSSTAARQIIAGGTGSDSLLSEPIAAYAAANGLYKN